MDNELEKIKREITNLLNKIYLEKDKKKLYPLMYKFYSLLNDKTYERKMKNWFLHKLPKKYDKKILKIGIIVFGDYSNKQKDLRYPDPGWIEYKENRDELSELMEEKLKRIKNDKRKP